MMKLSGNIRISIDKEKADDPYCRYTMTAVAVKDVLKDESKLGQRTIIINMDTIADDLKRSEEAIIGYLSSILGCKQINDDGKWTLYGRFTQDRIQDGIYEFINHFVLCKHCRKPETQFVVERRDTVLQCAACSKTSTITFNSHTSKVLKIIARQ